MGLDYGVGMPTSTRSQFGDLERAVLDVLWSLDEGRSASVREVHNAIAREREVAYTTVMTVLDRMHDKKLVTRESEGRAFRYRARASRGDLTAEFMRATLTDIGSSDKTGALVAFVSEASEAEREALRAALAELE